MKFKVTIPDIDLCHSTHTAVARFNELGVALFGDVFLHSYWDSLATLTPHRVLHRFRVNEDFAIVFTGELDDCPAAQEFVTLLEAVARGDSGRLYPDLHIAT